jgi:hypothetical protein
MRHSSVFTEYLPYSLALDPSSGTVPKNAPQTLTISGTVRGTDCMDVLRKLFGHGGDIDPAVTSTGQIFYPGEICAAVATHTDSITICWRFRESLVY